MGPAWNVVVGRCRRLTGLLKPRLRPTGSKIFFRTGLSRLPNRKPGTSSQVTWQARRHAVTHFPKRHERKGLLKNGNALFATGREV